MLKPETEIADEQKRRRVLHLTCCLLPKTHRDSLEILFSFLNWASSFSQVDEETGSKMDTHNLATVITPNILFPNSKNIGMDESFLAIEAVHSLIEYNDQMCEVSPVTNPSHFAPLTNRFRYPKISSPSSTTLPSSTKAPKSPPKKSSNATPISANRQAPNAPPSSPTPAHPPPLAQKRAATATPAPAPLSSPKSTTTPTKPTPAKRSPRSATS